MAQTSTPFDIAAIRAQFPILQTEMQGHPLHYLDNAATAQVPLAVLDACQIHDTQHRANVMRSVNTLAEQATDAFESARTTLARFINARTAEEVIFTYGTTSGINLVAATFGESLREGDEIVISLLEHHSNFVPWQQLCARKGATLKIIPPTTDGRVDLSTLGSLVTDRCKLISVVHASNATGAVIDVAPVVEAARAVGAKVLLDGAQYVPHNPVDVQALGVDFYAFSGHKMYGPSGIGVLWGRLDILAELPPFMTGGGMIQHVAVDKTTFAPPPHRFEAGTPPITQAVGLGAAAAWMMAQDLDGAGAHILNLTGRLMDGITDLTRSSGGKIQIFGPAGLQARLPVISLVIENAHPHDICQILDSHGVAIRGGHHCTLPLMTHFGHTGTSRASLTFYNTNADVDACLTGLEDALQRLT